MPGRSMQFLQILNKAGVKSLIISRHEQGFYNWRSPDGSGIRVWSPGHYMDPMILFAKQKDEEAPSVLAGILMKGEPFYQRHELKPVVPVMVARDMGAPPTYDPLMAVWDKAKASLTLPAVSYSTGTEAMNQVTAGRPDWPVIVGERPNVWLYIHGPTHHEAISAERDAAVLLTSAEKFWSVESLLAGNFDRYPTTALNAAWKAQIYPDHGWGGSLGHMTDATFRAKFEFARDEGQRLLDAAQQAVAGRVLTKPGKGKPIVVFNNLSWKRSDVVTVSLGGKTPPAQIIDAEGHDVPFQITSSPWPHEVNVALKTMGASATASSELSKDTGAEKVIDGQWLIPETEEWSSAPGGGPQWVTIDFGRPRNIQRVVILHHGAAGSHPQKMKPGQDEQFDACDFQVQASDSANGPWTDVTSPVKGNTAVMTALRFSPRLTRFLRVYITKSAPVATEPARLLEVEAYEEEPTPRQIMFVANDVPSIGYRTYYAVPSGKNPGPQHVAQVSTKTFENSYYRVTFAQGGIRQIYDKQLKRDLLRTDKFLGAELFTMQSKGTGAGEFAEVQQPTMEGFDKSSSHPTGWHCTETGPVRTVFAQQVEMPHVTVLQAVTVYSATKRIDVDVTLRDWDGTKYREFRLALPLNMQKATTSYEVPFGVVQVGKDEIRGAAGERYTQPVSEVHPREVQNWLGASDNYVGVTMSSSVAVADYVDPTTDPASYPVLQPVLLASRRSCHPWGNWYLQPGSHDFHFSISSHQPGWKNGYRFGIQANNPLRTVVAPARLPGAALPEEKSFLSVDAPNVILSTVKKWEDGDGLIVRAYDAEGKDTQVRIKLAVPIKHAELTNIIEEPSKAVRASANSLPLQIGHNAIETAEVTVF